MEVKVLMEVEVLNGSESVNGSEGESEVDIRNSRDTRYEIRNNTPGIYVRKGCTNRFMAYLGRPPYSLRSQRK